MTDISQHAQLTALLARYPEEAPGYQDAAVVVVMGEDASILAERCGEFMLSLPQSNWSQELGQIDVERLAIDSLMALSDSIPCIIAVSGHISEAEKQLAAELFALMAHCTVVVDAAAEVYPEWRSVIRLPPHRSRATQWAWFMRVYLDAMLNRGLICLDPHDIQACTQNRLSQFTVVHTKGEGRAIVGIERAVQSLARRCDLQACDTFLLLFHSGPDIRIKELHWGIQALRNAVDGLGCVDYLINVGHLPARDDKFVVSFLAGAKSP